MIMTDAADIKYTVGTLPGVGRVLFANRDIKVITFKIVLSPARRIGSRETLFLSSGGRAGVAGQGCSGRPR